MKYTHVIWDWNGTLLNDVEWSMSVINQMLACRGLPVLDTLEAYHKVFGFPVRDYYERLGFDFEKEPFEELAEEYIRLYYDSRSSAALFSGAVEILEAFKNGGICQIILSASEAGRLLSQIKPFNIDVYFDRILGISDIYATSKVIIAKEYIEQARPRKAVLIGDTVHDKEVADALGVDCVLVPNGHQSRSALLERGAVLAGCLEELRALVLKLDDSSGAVV